ncbi:polyketide synthase [Melittangium boletus DSM 14713]|uniref:Polyketide synthase n=2 Tax=Melittangium boletus TaxID=83453 RepID=A0A250ISA5_9BACT|nr:polyketide synthase [Melittangium boletus DSM 14713]
MSDVMEKLVRGLSPEKRVNLAKMLLRSAGESVPESSATEPIAIIGVGCRFPGGANSPESYWKLLSGGVDAVQEVPSSRWDVNAYYDPDPSVPGKVYTRNGAFVDGVDLFDPYFFGIPPRSAVNLDPQHRLLLEVTWEALENAGISPRSLAGSKTGIFVGGATGEYTQLRADEGADRIDASYLTGTLLTFATGRLSHFLDLQGPSLAVDTACSSSLVAVHLACQSLRSGESSLALVGGVSLLLMPQGWITTSKARMLAVDGRCKTFDASADGYGRGEGCGMVVLKRLSEAIKDEDNILAVIRGTATNQDGHSSDLTVPNGLAQQQVIRKALDNAGLQPEQVDYVEAHGTGTALGDPIEMRAIGAVFGPTREKSRPLRVGSVKTNIGHLEFASGIAGLIKLALSLKHREIPAHLHFKRGNPYIPWNELPVEIPTQLTPWAAGQGPRVAGVSSFGASGTNAHVVLEEAPEVERKAEGKGRPLHVMSLSARNAESLRELASRYVKYLEAHPEAKLEEVCFTANAGRAHFAHRAAVVAESVQQLREQVEALAKGEAPEQGAVSREAGRVQEVVFLFTGQGSQAEGMGQELYETEPVFRETMKRCDEVLRPLMGESLVEVLYGGKGALLSKASVAQPALFAVEYALAKVWMGWGVKPGAVLGHSLGEYVAACVAEVMSLEEGLELVAKRGQLMEGLGEKGKMVVVMAEEGKVRQALKGKESRVSVAAVNGPRETVVAGGEKEVEGVVEELRKEGVESRELKTTHAFHSPLMEPMLEEYGKVLGKVKWGRPSVELVGNVSGRPVKGEEVSQGEYWKKQVREPVKYWEGLKGLYERGQRVFVEVGPKPTLVAVGRKYLGEEGEWVGTLKPGVGDWKQMLGGLAKLYARGVEVDWASVSAGGARRRTSLPTYPFQRERYWIDSLIPNTDTLVSFYRSVVHLLEVNSAFEVPSLRFATLREVIPGFSWISLYRPEPQEQSYRAYYDIALKANQEMARILYRGVDFSTRTRVLDIGCGHAADLVDLARAHPHLELHGCNISPDQIEVGRQRIRALGLDGRVLLHYQDSSRDQFPSTYDLVIAYQVIHHIRAKSDLFANISRSMKPGGLLIMAETMSNMVSPIEHPESTTQFVPVGEWAELLARNHLRVVECVDATQEIANFLHDAEFPKNFERVTRDSDAVTREHLHGIHMLGELLSRRLAAYGLFMVTKDDSRDVETLRRINRTQLNKQLPYATAYSQVEAKQYVVPPVPEVSASAADSETSAFAHALLNADASQRGVLLDGYLREQTANLLRMPAAKLDLSQPLHTLGMDSLLTMELKHKIHVETGVNVPLDELLEGASLARLSKSVAERLSSTGVAAPKAADWEEGEL